MQRYKSIDSITSGTSSQRVGEKKVPPTHMLIQREVDNEIMLLPVTHIVNGSVIGIKINKTATFKTDINDRKQYRGRIVQLGTEEQCAEQYQVFEMAADVCGENLGVKTHQAKKTNDSQKHKTYFEKQKASSINRCGHVMTNSNSNASPKCTNQRQYTNQNKKTNRHLVDERNIEDDIFNMASINLPNEKTLSTNLVHDASQDSSGKENRSTINESRTEKCNRPQRTCNSQIIVHSEPRDINNVRERESITVLDISGSGQDHQLPNINGTTMLIRFDELSKRCNDLTKENGQLRLERDQLIKDNEILKRTTIPMPDAGGRQWIVNTAKIFNTKSSNADIVAHAKALNIDDPRDLIGCIQDTTSNTARQVVRLLYSPEQLLCMTGPEVPKAVRSAIREFAESQKGPILDHQFNEAVNGVFRSKKCEVKSKNQKDDKPISMECTRNVSINSDVRDKSQRTLEEIMNKRDRSKAIVLSFDEEDQDIEDESTADDS